MEEAALGSPTFLRPPSFSRPPLRLLLAWRKRKIKTATRELTGEIEDDRLTTKSEINEEIFHARRESKRKKEKKIAHARLRLQSLPPALSEPELINAESSVYVLHCARAVRANRPASVRRRFQREVPWAWATQSALIKTAVTPRKRVNE